MCLFVFASSPALLHVFPLRALCFQSRCAIALDRYRCMHSDMPDIMLQIDICSWSGRQVHGFTDSEESAKHIGRLPLRAGLLFDNGQLIAHDIHGFCDTSPKPMWMAKNTFGLGKLTWKIGVTHNVDPWFIKRLTCLVPNMWARKFLKKTLSFVYEIYAIQQMRNRHIRI